MLTKLINKNKVDLYIIIASLCVFLFVLFSIITNFEAIKWAVMGNTYDWCFTDYFRQIVYASDLKNIYFNTNDAPFPPLSYIFYHLLFLINPFSASVELQSWTIARDNYPNLIIFIAIEIVLCLLFVYSLYLFNKSSFGKRKSLIFALLILLSIPFLFGAIERGNIIILVISLILLAIYFKDKNDKLYNELALIMIAIAASIKVYPAIIGLLYIKEKRYKEAFKLIVYGLLFFIVPFIFVGGIKGLLQYVAVLLKFTNSLTSKWTSISCFIFAISESLFSKVDKNAILPIVKVIQNLFLLINLLSFFKTKNRCISIMLLFSILAIYVPDSYRYTSCYMLIPFIYLLSDSNTRFNNIYFVLLSMIFIIPIYAYICNISIVDFCIYLPIYLLNLICYIEVWICK